MGEEQSSFHECVGWSKVVSKPRSSVRVPLQKRISWNHRTRTCFSWNFIWWSDHRLNYVWLVISTPRKKYESLGMIIPKRWENMFKTTNQMWCSCHHCHHDQTHLHRLDAHVFPWLLASKQAGVVIDLLVMSMSWCQGPLSGPWAHGPRHVPRPTSVGAKFHPFPK